MEMYNADGSRGKMCGNGIRCLGKYVYDKGLTRRTSLQVDTDSGLRALRLLPGPAGIGQVEVDMGEPSVFPQISIPLMELTYSVMPVSMGNPHCILFCPHPEEIALDVLGPALERRPVFPDRYSTPCSSTRCIPVTLSGKSGGIRGLPAFISSWTAHWSFAAPLRHHTVLHAATRAAA